MNEFESSIIIRLLCKEILRLEGQMPIRPPETFVSGPTRGILVRPTANNTWKKLKRDEKTGRFRKGRKR